MHLVAEEKENEDEVFSTPPTTPMIASIQDKSSNDAMKPPPSPSRTPSRRGSRPSSLQLSGEDHGRGWNGNVRVEVESSASASSDMPADRPKRVFTGGNDDDARAIHSQQQLQQQHADADADEGTWSGYSNSNSATVLDGPEASHTHTMENHVLSKPAVLGSGSGGSSGNNENDADRSSSSTAATITDSASTGSATVTERTCSPASNHPSSNSHSVHLQSPCFVHSFLDKGASLADWLKGKGKGKGKGKHTSSNMPDTAHSTTIDDTPTKQPQQQQYQATQPSTTQSKHSHGPYIQAPHPAIPLPPSQHSPGSSPESEFDDDEDGSSLTRQLAETAVGVREMSKQLGRARIRSNIQNVLIITKARDNRLIKLTRELALYLMLKPRNDGRGLVVYVDNQLRFSKRFDAAGIQRDHPELFVPFPRRKSSSNGSLASLANGNASSTSSEQSFNQEGQLRYWTSDMCSRSPHLFDFVVTLGGDGTVLFTSWLFQRIVPPVLPFALGSLGFLTNFDFADHKAVMDSAIDNGIRVNLRMRFTCTVYRAIAPEPGRGRRAIKKADTGEIMMRNLEKGGWEALEGGWSESTPSKEGKKCAKDKEIMCFTTRPVESFEVLNDLVVDRGPSPYMSLLELFGDEHHMTTVQADGLTIATPTGSTAYSLSAGGSLVHPEIPAILITPICPHTLSFRPMLLPDSMELRICVPFNSRSTAWASFDGRGRIELKQGDHIKVTASKYPFPTVCADKQSTDWFHAISRTLKWNERERQKSFVVVEEGPMKTSRKNSKEVENVGRTVAKPGIAESPEDEKSLVNEEEDEVSDEGEGGEEEEEKFDIDDSSAPEASWTPSSTDLVAMAKAQEEEREKEEEARAREAAIAMTGSGSESIFKGLRERSRTMRSGIQTPDRFVGAHPHPPNVSPRHVSFGNINYNVSAGVGAGGHETPGEKGDRDHIHSPRMLSGGKSRIPRDRDLEAESANMKTPTVASWRANVVHRAPREPSSVGRAFACWGHDESDSNTSDSDV